MSACAWSRRSGNEIGLTPHVARYVAVGGAMALVQLALLTLLIRDGWPDDWSDTIAIVLTTELSFVLSSLFTWRDRLSSRGWGARWLRFHLCTGSMAVLNLAVFLGTHLLFPTVVAWTTGIVIAGAGNFLLAQHVVFRRPANAA